MFTWFVPTLLMFASTATTAQFCSPKDLNPSFASKKVIRMGDLELSARKVEVRADSLQLASNANTLLNFSLSGEARIKVGDLVAQADQIRYFNDRKGTDVLRLQGNCQIKAADIRATADRTELRFADHQLLLQGGNRGARLIHGNGDKATVLEASSILYDIGTRQVQLDEISLIQFGKGVEERR